MRANGMRAGFTNAMKSPDDTLIFVTPEEEKHIRNDQADCMGCLSQCAFSSWADNEKNSTGRLADPRSFCIQKTLAGNRPWRAGRAESDVRRPFGVPLQERPILFERLRPDREAAGRSDPDGGVMPSSPSKRGSLLCMRWIPFAGDVLRRRARRRRSRPTGPRSPAARR